MHHKCNRFQWYKLFCSTKRENVDKSLSIYEEPPKRSNKKNCKECPYIYLCRPESKSDQRAVIPRAICSTCGFLDINHVTNKASCANGLKFESPCASHVYKPCFITFDEPVKWHDNPGTLEYKTFTNGVSEVVSLDKDNFTSEELEGMFENV